MIVGGIVSATCTLRAKAVSGISWVGLRSIAASALSRNDFGVNH